MRTHHTQVVRGGSVIKIHDNLPESLQRINLQFSPDMSPDEVAQCLRQCDKMNLEQKRRLEDIQRKGISLEGLLSISKVVTPISLFLHNNISSSMAISLAFTGSEQVKRMFGENLRLADQLKDDFRAIERLKGTAGVRANSRAAIREMQPKIQEFSDSIHKTASIVHSKKLENYDRILSSRQRTADLARKGILIESLNPHVA